jgi:peptidoglycan/LPS O-acetylase OafA/YrhL
LELAKFAHYFLAGVLAAAVYVEFPEWARRQSRAADFAAGACFLVFLGVTIQWKELSGLTLPWLFGGVLLFAMKAISVGKWLRLPFVARTGGMCYTIYLYHGRLLTLPIIFLFSRIRLSGNYAWDILILTVLLVPGILAVSTVIYSFFERPFMNPKWPELLRLSLQRSLNRTDRKAEWPAAPRVPTPDSESN